jgi:hypothetical protein
MVMLNCKLRIQCGPELYRLVQHLRQFLVNPGELHRQGQGLVF